jgi:hypothetical protein
VTRKLPDNLKLPSERSNRCWVEREDSHQRTVAGFWGICHHFTLVFGSKNVRYFQKYSAISPGYSMPKISSIGAEWKDSPLAERRNEQHQSQWGASPKFFSDFLHTKVVFTKCRRNHTS